MEIKGTLLIDASPALLGVMNKFADALTTSVTVGAEPEKKQRKSRKVVAEAPSVEEAEAVKEMVPETAPETAPEAEEAAPETSEVEPAKEDAKSVTIEAVRALMVQKAKTNREAVKQALTGCGASKIGDLAEEKYEEFYNKLLSL